MKSQIFFILFYIKKEYNKIFNKIKILHCYKKNKKELEEYDIDYDRCYKKLLEKRIEIPVCFDIINNKSSKDLSIIIPIYNSEKTIKKCLDSITYQNLKVSYEIICINDGSTDKSLNILNELSQENCNIRIISQNNKGLSGARNTGLNSCVGKYILFIDSDDFLCENTLNKYMELIKKENADILVGRIKKYIPKYDVSFKLKYSNKSNGLIDICNNTTGTAWGKIYRRDLWNDIRFFEGYMYEDTITFLNIFFKAEKIISSEIPLYNFRSSNSSLFKRSKKNYSTIDMLWQIKKMEEMNYFKILDNSKLQIIIWNISSIIYERIAALNDEEVLKNCFVVSKNIIDKVLLNYKKKIVFYGKNKKLYEKLMSTYEEMNYFEWKKICALINNSSLI